MPVIMTADDEGPAPHPDSEQSLNRVRWEPAHAAQAIDGTCTGEVWWVK